MAGGNTMTGKDTAAHARGGQRGSEATTGSASGTVFYSRAPSSDAVDTTAVTSIATTGSVAVANSSTTPTAVTVPPSAPDPARPIHQAAKMLAARREAGAANAGASAAHTRKYFPGGRN